MALPGTDGTVRGFSSVNLLVIDEASRVDDTLYKGLRPMLLVTELQDMERWEGGSGKVRMGAQGAGQHDDLVIALALACWRAGWKDIGGHEGPLF